MLLIPLLDKFVEPFQTVAMSDPLSAVLLTIGAALTGLTMAVGGYLVAGSIVDAVIPPRPGRTHPERG